MAPLPLSTEERRHIEAAKTYILNHLHKSLTVQEVAAQVGTLPYQLKNGFLRLYQMPMVRYVYEVRMQTAAILLRHTHRSVKDIAITLGYSTSQNFIKQFRKYFGHNPTEYRARHTS